MRRLFHRAFDRCLKPLVEAAILRLSNRGDISVTVRYVTEVKQLPCAACNASGRQPVPFGMTLKQLDISGQDAVLQHHMVMQGICLACRGKGAIAP